VTAFEDMHAAKPHLEYYQEILDRLGRRAEECIMVGDDWERDITPAASIGIEVFWVTVDCDPKPSALPHNLWLGQGSLNEFFDLLFDGETSQSQSPASGQIK
jgi:FMN phosphatase YigB (HAD superfamily)